MRAIRLGLLALLGGLGVATLSTLSTGCGGGGGHGFFVTNAPIISNINGATNPASPPGQAIQINGSVFGANPGTVRFTQNNTTTTASVPSASWTDTSILVVVPASLSAPGSAAVTVVSASGTASNSVNLDITPTPSFTPANVTWTPTQALPTPNRALVMTAVDAAGNTVGFVYAIGGNTGTADVSSVLVAGLASTGAVGSWTQANALPAPRAFAAVAEADPGNSPVPVGSAFIYVIGGQQSATDAPGGTNTVFIGTVNRQTGSVAWTNGSTLPETRVGAAAAVFNGFLYVTGGLSSTGNAINTVASAPINQNGTLGTFTESGNGTIPTPVAFHQTFAFGGFLYVLGGDTGPITNVFSTSAAQATANAWFAPVQNGTVGTFSPTGSLIKPREKFVLLQSSGQVLVFEGAYGATNFEGERSSIGSTGQLAAFNGQNGATAPGLNVIAPGGFVSPVLTSANTPRFVIGGGEAASTPGALSAAVSTGGP